MARIIPMPMDLAETLDTAGRDMVRQLTGEIPAVLISDQHPTFRQQAYKEQIIEAADKIGGLVLEYHYGWHNHEIRYFFAVESIEAFEVLVSIFEIMAY